MTGPERLRWWWISLAIIVVDRATKAAVEAYTPENFHRALVPRAVYLVHAHNPGIAFGLLSDSRSQRVAALLMFVSAAVIVLLAWLLATHRAGGWLGQTGLALILAGAAGNLMDRLLQGSVTDFFEVWLGSYHWPAFNVADSAITIGALLVILELFIGHRHPTEQKA